MTRGKFELYSFTFSAPMLALTGPGVPILSPTELTAAATSAKSTADVEVAASAHRRPTERTNDAPRAAPIVAPSSSQGAEVPPDDEDRRSRRSTSSLSVASSVEFLAASGPESRGSPSPRRHSPDHRAPTRDPRRPAARERHRTASDGRAQHDSRSSDSPAPSTHARQAPSAASDQEMPVHKTSSAHSQGQAGEQCYSLPSSQPSATPVSAPPPTPTYAPPVYSEPNYSQQVLRTAQATSRPADQFLPSNAEYKLNLFKCESEYRRRNRAAWAHRPDNGKTLLHPLRLEPWVNMEASELFKIGLEFAIENQAPPMPHNLSHLQNGMLIDGRAYMLAASLSDPDMVLRRFLPGTFEDRGSTASKPLLDMRECLKAFSIYSALIKRTRSWDLTPEILWDYLIEADLYNSDDRPHAGYYRMPEHKPHLACASLIEAVHRTYVEFMGHVPKLMDFDAIESVHIIRCKQEPHHWSPTAPQLRRAPFAASTSRGDRASRAPRPKRAPKPPNQSCNDLGKIKLACRTNGQGACQAYNLKQTCNRPLNPAGTACIMVKGTVTTELLHVCPFTPTPGAARCGQSHPMMGAH